MPDERERRLGLNESAFRVANERMDEWPERRTQGEPATYHCECSELMCRERIDLRRGEYEHLRSNSRWFALVPGHEVPDVETVIDRHDDWYLIQKDSEVADIVKETDPRREETEQRRN